MDIYDKIALSKEIEQEEEEIYEEYIENKKINDCEDSDSV